MNEILLMLQSGSFKLAFAFIAAAMLFFVLLRLDRGIGLSFRQDVLPELRKGNVAVAVYFGARIVAVAILIGMALG